MTPRAGTLAEQRRASPPVRPEYVRAVVAANEMGVVEKPLAPWQKLLNQGWVRKALILAELKIGRVHV